jgi:hypothetical protein
MMMQPHTPHNAPLVMDRAWFESVYQALDRLHDGACAGSLSNLSPVGPAEIVGCLEEFIYTAQETILEIRALYPGENVTKAERFS